MAEHVIVIGGGHNGLVCAAYLARGGRRVTVLERRDRLGGICAADDVAPGYRATGLLHDTSGLRPAVVKELGLEKHGLGFVPAVPVLVAGGDGLVTLTGQEEATATWRAFVERVRPFLVRVLDSEPPEVTREDLGTLWKMLVVGLGLRRLGPGDMNEVTRVPPMPVSDWLREHIDDDRIVAGMAVAACSGGWVGPHSAGTAAVLLLNACLSTGREVAGGPAGLIAALEAACSAAGVTVRTSAEVRRIRLEGGRAVGVELADGVTLDGTVVSSCDPKRTFLGLVEPAALPSELGHAIERVRMRGTTARIGLALSGPLEVGGMACEALRVAAGVDAVEKAFDAVKYRRFSERPVLDVRVPSMADASLAPLGHHVASVLVHFAPWRLDGGWTDAAREALGDAVVEVLAGVAPGLRERIVAREVLTPVDLEQRYGLTEGHVLHGEHALDQLLSLRPVAACAGHRTPIRGLYLCGSGTHPGGGITGGPGRLGARAVLAG